MKQNMILSQNLLSLRKAHRKNQDQIAEICCVNRTAVSCWERGTRNPNVDSLDILSKYYGIATDVLVNRKLEVYYEASTKKVKVRTIEIPDGWSLESESTKMIIEGNSFKGLLTNPRKGLEREKAYQEYKRAVEIDYAVDVDDERILEAMDGYWYAFDHGVDEAGTNLLRIYFLITLVSQSLDEEVIQTMMYLIDEMREKYDPSGDYYYTLCVMYNVFSGLGGLEVGIKMMKQLADNENEYAVEAITYLEKGRDVLWGEQLNPMQ